MLTELLVRNVALVPETTIHFSNGLNILSGETGAGKSIVLGALNLALGQKAGAQMIGRFGDAAYVEATFDLKGENKEALLRELDLEDCDGEIIISRKLMPNKSVLKINGEMASQATVRQLTSQLIDIHGQHDHQTLLYKNHHLEILDRYAKESSLKVKEDLAGAYQAYTKAIKALEEYNLSEEEIHRNTSFIQYELEEIQKANLTEGEDEELERSYRKMVNAKRITEEVSTAYDLTHDGQVNALDLVGRAINSIHTVVQYDEALEGMMEEISNIEGLLSDVGREMQDYLSALEYDENAFLETQHRLDEWNHLKSKYGHSYQEIMDYATELEKKLAFYEEYESRKERAKDEVAQGERRVQELCDILSTIRMQTMAPLEEAITKALMDLNFPQVVFKIERRALEHLTANGADEIEFMVSLNPGEALKPLSQIASGGEMSRIMLGIKSVLAGQDEIPTLIFDEIDTGISGRTAQKVSEKMAEIACHHQLICITHLPQIAAMADSHYLIDKAVLESGTVTSVNALGEAQMTDELARMLGGLEITKEVSANAAQMKQMANAYKASIH